MSEAGTGKFWKFTFGKRSGSIPVVYRPNWPKKRICWPYWEHKELYFQFRWLVFV